MFAAERAFGAALAGNAVLFRLSRARQSASLMELGLSMIIPRVGGHYWSRQG
jgi:hypothetical protein